MIRYCAALFAVPPFSPLPPISRRACSATWWTRYRIGCRHPPDRGKAPGRAKEIRQAALKLLAIDEEHRCKVQHEDHPEPFVRAVQCSWHEAAILACRDAPSKR